MLGPVRALALGRLGAAAVALALTGAPGVVALHAPEPPHHCTCRSGEGPHACGCARCHPPPARPAAVERSAPCHGAAPRRSAPARAGDRAAPCWVGSCGASDPAGATLLAFEVFVAPGAWRSPAPALSGHPILALGEAVEVPRSPDPPPPRPA